MGEYIYDGYNQRTTDSHQDTSEVFHYVGAGALIAETLPSGSVNDEYVYLNGQLLAKRCNNCFTHSY